MKTNVIYLFDTETRHASKLELRTEGEQHDIISIQLDTEDNPMSEPKYLEHLKGPLDNKIINKWLEYTSPHLVAQSFAELQISKLRWSSIYGNNPEDIPSILNDLMKPKSIFPD